MSASQYHQIKPLPSSILAGDQLRRGTQVHLCGSFTRWVETMPMAPMDGAPDTFAVVVHLPPGCVPPILPPLDHPTSLPSLHMCRASSRVPAPAPLRPPSSGSGLHVPPPPPPPGGGQASFRGRIGSWWQQRRHPMSVRQRCTVRCCTSSSLGKGGRRLNVSGRVRLTC